MSNLPYVLNGKYTQGHPLDMEDARIAARALASMRHDVRRRLEDAVTELATAHNDLAEKERLYRKARAEAYVTAAVKESKAAGERDSKVDDGTADKRKERDIAKGLVEAQKERIKLLHAELAEVDGDRASFHRLVEWSMRVDPFAQEQRRPEPAR